MMSCVSAAHVPVCCQATVVIATLAAAADVASRDIPVR